MFVENNSYRPIEQGSNAVSIDMDLLQVGSEPVGLRCPYCQEDVMTRANYVRGRLTHLVAAVLAIFCWALCCCLVPYAVKRWKNVEHYCPRCHRFLGVYTRSSII
ncbi:hypothetical protein JYU34_011062 [Plutella xylostella]|uniref:LITAF domain-containing protein n=1 Tax=Plutella xylostella TaxID=51655 RepID=A0ABQ7QH98_PLUXY|nr:LITAF domain-containing protein isoform X1 [Plutella xylostella]KAG7304129.1 hypothetical protein JYU34_011062 [Plutella xylostella]